MGSTSALHYSGWLDRTLCYGIANRPTNKFCTFPPKKRGMAGSQQKSTDQTCPFTSLLAAHGTVTTDFFICLKYFPFLLLAHTFTVRSCKRSSSSAKQAAQCKCVSKHFPSSQNGLLQPLYRAYPNWASQAEGACSAATHHYSPSVWFRDRTEMQGRACKTLIGLYGSIHFV